MTTAKALRDLITAALMAKDEMCKCREFPHAEMLEFCQAIGRAQAALIISNISDPCGCGVADDEPYCEARR